MLHKERGVHSVGMVIAHRKCCQLWKSWPVYAERPNHSNPAHEGPRLQPQRDSRALPGRGRGCPPTPPTDPCVKYSLTRFVSTVLATSNLRLLPAADA
jgi:hypothetical protein